VARFDEQTRALILGPKRAFRTLDFPGRPDVKVAVRALTEREIDACRVEAQRQFLALCKQREWNPDRAINIDPLLHSRLVDRQIVWRAYYDPDTVTMAEPVAFFGSDADVQDLDSITLSDLISAYAEHQEYVSPSRSLDVEEVRALVDALGKESKPAVVLRSLARDALESFALTTARRLATFQTGK